MDEEVQIVTPPANDPDIEGLGRDASPSANPKAPLASSPGSAGQTVAPKGEVTGAAKRPRTPAERLGLNDKQRVRAEKCLADAVYFESRGEVKRGQIAVAQVVMNRVFSGFYPNNVCGVVYQNAHRKLACQFTFACDGIPDVVKEPDMWGQAKEIARDMLDGKLWLLEAGHSTHYHAPTGRIRPGCARCAGCRRSACTAFTGRAPGATAPRCRRSISRWRSRKR